MSVLNSKSKKKVLVFCIALLMMMAFAVAAQADDNVVLVSVSVDGGNPTSLLLNELTLANSLDIGSMPTFRLHFSHNIANPDYNQANQELVEMLDEGGSPLLYYTELGTGGNSDLFITPGVGLEEGSYSIVVAAGITANAGSTTETYVIHFNVGTTPIDDPGDEPGTYKVTFNVSGVTNTDHFVNIVDEVGKPQVPRSDGSFRLFPGSYYYSVSAAGHTAESSFFTVGSQDQTINVTLRDRVTVKIISTVDNVNFGLKDAQEIYLTPVATTSNSATFIIAPGKEYTYVVYREQGDYKARSTRFTPTNDMEVTAALEAINDYVPGEYNWQGTGGNMLKMLRVRAGASLITGSGSSLNIDGAVAADEIVDAYADITNSVAPSGNDGYYYNIFNNSIDTNKDIVFGFTMDAGINSFNRDFFLEMNMPIIKVYNSYNNGPVGAPVADYAGGGLLYIQYEGAGTRTINIGIKAGTLADGTYVLVYGKNVCGNNVNKTIGNEIVFEFTIAGSGGTGGTGGTTTVPATTAPTAPTTAPTVPTTAPPAPGVPVPAVANFKDLDFNGWYMDAITFVATEGLFRGTSETEFSPATLMNRGMFITVLARLAKVEGSPLPDGMSFSDVPANAYYAPYLPWAIGKKIIYGYDDGTFGATSGVSRQELVTMLYRFAGTMGYDRSQIGTEKLNQFTDVSLVAGWAKDAMAWAVNMGIMGGKGDGKCDPLGTATRAEVAKFIKNFVDVYPAGTASEKVSDDK